MTLNRRITVQLYARLALGIGFLSPVADRFGLWGPRGTPGVGWGDFAHFTAYTAQVNSFLPAQLAPGLAWAATAAEIVLGVALIVGFQLRITAACSALLLFLFGAAMTISFGIHGPLNYSVFAASSAALLLAEAQTTATATSR